MKNKQKGNIIIWLSIPLILIALVLIKSKMELKSLEANDKCIEAMYQAVPDVNDMEARSKFLKECYEN